MAEDKKPKIDLKARLGKMQGSPSMPPPAPVPSSPSGRPLPQAAIPAPPGIPASSSSVPQGIGGMPPGIPIGAPSPFGSQPAPLDPSNPLAAVAQPGGFRAPSGAPAHVAPAVPQPQRIEVDEAGVQQARRDARKQGIILAAVASVLFAGVGYAAGGASEQSSGRQKSLADATELAGDVGKAKESLKVMLDKLEAGREQIKQRKFPDALARDLSVNVDFDGTKLAGRRFSGFSVQTTQSLVELVTAVQGVNDRKSIIIALLNKLQKPLTEQLAAPAGQQAITQVVVVDKDPAGNPAAFLAGLAAPITASASKIELPNEFTFGKPGGGGNVTAPRYKSGDMAKSAAALYVVPKSFEAVCPSETSGQLAQLSAQIGNMARDIKGEGASAEGMDPKPGVVERADRLQQALLKVAQQ